MMTSVFEHELGEQNLASHPWTSQNDEAWERYLSLREQRAEDFLPSPLLPIIDDLNQIMSFSKKTGRIIGVVYESPFRILVVDLVMGADGPFPFERILPAAQGDAVVMIPLWEGRFVLLEQFRHALRACQLAFPRGFGENGLSAKENACKEIREELRAEVVSLQLLGEIASDSSLVGSRAQVVVCEVTKPNPLLQYEEIQGMVCLQSDELEKAIAQGQIDDAFTLAAFSLYKAQIKE